MKLKIIKMNGEEIILDCTSFEFRSNNCKNRIRVINKDGTYTIHNISIIRSANYEVKE